MHNYTHLFFLPYAEKPFGSSSTPHRIRTWIIEASPEPIREMPWGLSLALLDSFLQAKTGVRVEEFNLQPFHTFGWRQEDVIWRDGEDNDDKYRFKSPLPSYTPIN